MRTLRTLSILSAIACLNTAGAAAQTRANDPSARLAQVLPADVAAQVLAVIAKARAHELPTQALENRALKFAAKGVHPDSIKKSVEEQERRMETANDALRRGRGQKPTDDEIDAGAEAIRKGVDGAKVSELAKSAPSGRSLAVPLRDRQSDRPWLAFGRRAPAGSGATAGPRGRSRDRATPQRASVARCRGAGEQADADGARTCGDQTRRRSGAKRLGRWSPRRCAGERRCRRAPGFARPVEQAGHARAEEAIGPNRAKRARRKAGPFAFHPIP